MPRSDKDSTDNLYIGEPTASYFCASYYANGRLVGLGIREQCEWLLNSSSTDNLRMVRGTAAV
jgi:hypothetical protein